MKDYVFISYSSRNIAFVSRLTAEMKKNNIPYWKAPDNIPAGSNYAKEIPKAIAGSLATILIVSAQSQNSIWVEKEIDLSVCEKKTIIPIMIDDTPLNDMYRFYLNNVQMVPYTSDKNKLIKDAIECIRDIKANAVVKNKETSTEGLAGDNLPKGADIIEKNLTNDADPADDNITKNERLNALRINRIPVRCKECNLGLNRLTMGIYVCQGCGREYYDDYQKIRNYIETNGAAPAAVISRAVNVPLKTIDYFFREEYLEIPVNDTVRLECSGCGALIRTGTLCDKCKESINNIQKDKWHYRNGKNNLGNRQ